MSELLATLLSGIGAGAQQYGKGLGERAMANQEEKKAMQNKLRMKQIQDGMDYEKQRAIIAATRPELLEVYDRSTNQAGILRPLDDSDLKMLDSHVTARKAQEQLDAMTVNQQTQSAMGNTARQGGLDSPLGVTPQTPSAQQAYQMDYSTFAEPAQQEANAQMQSDNPPSMNRRGMSGDNPGASLATAVDIYMKKKMQAESNRNILSAKNANEVARLQEPTKTALEIESEQKKIKAGVKKAPSDLSEQETSDLKREWRGVVRQINFYNAKLKSNGGAWEKLSPEMQQLGQELAMYGMKSGKPGDPLPTLTFDEYVKMTDPGTGGDELDAILKERGL